MHVTEEVAPTEMGQSAPVSAPRPVSTCDECGTRVIPAGIRSEAGSSIRLRCFVRKGGERGYLAECIDLDLGAESETLEGAVNGLHDAMLGYLMVVLDGVETDQEAPAAVLRPAPLSHRIRYHWEYVKYKIGALFGGYHQYKRKFYVAPYGLGNLPCHV